MTHITYRSGVSIAVLIAYVPILFIAIFLSIRHGFFRSAGWRYLLTFAIARILGAAFELATINDPTNTSLYIGEWVLLGIALSPLELVSLGFLSRVVGSINKTRKTLLTPRHLRLFQLLNTVGLVLGIVGGTQTGDSYNSATGSLTPSALTKAAIALFILSFGLIVLAAALVWPAVDAAEPGEKRLLLAIAATAPFLLVRLVYSAVSVFDRKADFNPVTGNVSLLLGMAYIMELVIVVIFEGVGLTLKKLPKPQSSETVEMNNKMGA